MRISIAVNSFSSQAYSNGQLQHIRKEDLTAYEIYVVNSRIPVDQPRLYVPDTIHSHTKPSTSGQHSIVWRQIACSIPDASSEQLLIFTPRPC